MSPMSTLPRKLIDLRHSSTRRLAISLALPSVAVLKFGATFWSEPPFITKTLAQRVSLSGSPSAISRVQPAGERADPIRKTERLCVQRRRADEGVACRLTGDLHAIDDLLRAPAVRARAGVGAHEQLQAGHGHRLLEHLALHRNELLGVRKPLFVEVADAEVMTLVLEVVLRHESDVRLEVRAARLISCSSSFVA